MSRPLQYREPPDPVESHSFRELYDRYPDLPGAGRAEIFYGSGTRAQVACWQGVLEHTNAKNDADWLIEKRRYEPWCPECHDRLNEHEPGRGCTKYSIPENGSPTRSSWGSGRVESDHTDVLKTVPANVYVSAFIGIPVPAHGRIVCPLHDARNPSVFKCYGTSWTCFAGCGRGADIYDLAGALTGIEAKGSGFFELRRWIATRLLEGGVRV